MRKAARYKSTRTEELKQILLKHIHTNLKDYLILSIIFIIGVMVGVVVINNSNEQSKAEVSGYINSFVDTIKNENYEVDTVKLMQTSIVENLKLIAIIWVAGSTIIGIPLIYVITIYKGFCMGYTISAIIASLGVGKRNNVCIFIPFFAKCDCNSYNINAECECFEFI